MSISLQGPSEPKDKKSAFFADKYNILLILILMVATILRFFALDKQSLWLDELHTMNEASPNLNLKGLFSYLACCDQHPPLYFFIEKILFIVFGHTSLVARSLSAVIGVGSVWVMYILGRELNGKRLGLIAAAFTCVNYYNIMYSQEARGYILAFFFAALSFLYFFRLVKRGSRFNIWLYSLSALGVMYTHYFGMFLVTGEFLAVGILWLLSKSDRKQLFRIFFFSAVIIVLGYLPWLPFLRDMSQIKSFWIGTVDLGFIKKFFRVYFGNSSLLDPLLMAGLILYIFFAIKAFISFPGKIRTSAIQLSFIAFFFSILATYGIPYVRSILVVPMLFDRYTIVILPAFLTAIAFGFDLIQFNWIRSLLVTAFLLFSLFNIIIKIKYYTDIRKTQFRELTEFIVKDKKYEYPILNQRTSWQHQYYLDHYQYKGRVIVGQKDAIVDSILSKSSAAYDLPGFWIIGAHGNETKITDSTRAALDTAYKLVQSKDFYDAWAELYISRHPDKK